MLLYVIAKIYLRIIIYLITLSFTVTSMLLEGCRKRVLTIATALAFKRSSARNLNFEISFYTEVIMYQQKR